MTGGEIALIIGAIGTAGGFSALATVVRDVRKERKERDIATRAELEERIRAEFYKREAESTISQKNMELQTWRERHDEKASQLTHLREVEWPRLRKQIDDLVETNLHLSRKADGA